MDILSNLSASAALRRGHKLLHSGSNYKALQHMVSANRRHEDLRLERAFVDILLQTTPGSEPTIEDYAGAGSSASARLANAPGTIPEIGAADLNATVLREAIERSGHLIVRDFFAREDADRLRHCVDASLNARVDVTEGRESRESPWYYPSPHFPGNHQAYAQRNNSRKYHRTGSFKVIDSPRGSFTVLETYRKYGLKQLISEYFGEPAVIATRKWVFRHVQPRKYGNGKGIGGGWHQDGQFMGETVRALNMWVPLNDCGEGTAAPGITLVPKKLDRILEFGTRGANLNWVVGPELVEEVSADVGVVEPTFSAGDALFFDHFSLHRSGLRPGQSENRYALESWFYAQEGHNENSSVCFY